MVTDRFEGNGPPANWFVMEVGLGNLADVGLVPEPPDV